MGKRDLERPDIGEEAQGVIRFFEGSSFKILMSLLVVVGIAYALFTGGLSTGRVPAPNEGLYPHAGADKYPGVRPRLGLGEGSPRTDVSKTAAGRRFDAYQKRGNQ